MSSAAITWTISPGSARSRNVAASRSSPSSSALRILIEDRSRGEGFVVDTPRIWSVALAGLR